MPSMSRPYSRLALAVCLLALAGCSGKKGATVKGTLVPPPNVQLAGSDVVQMLFAAQDPGGQNSPVSFPSGPQSFVANGPVREGVLPGKYKITVAIQSYGVAPDPKHAAALAALSARYDDAHTKLMYEVTRDSVQTITVDLGQGTVTRQ